MRLARIVNRTRDTVLAEQAQVADTFPTRLAGLIGRSELNPGTGLVLSGTNSIHMFFMSIALDVVFLDKQGFVRHTMENLRPWQFSPIVRGATTTLELPVGVIAATSTQVGDSIEILVGG